MSFNDAKVYKLFDIARLLLFFLENIFQPRPEGTIRRRIIHVLKSSFKNVIPPEGKEISGSNKVSTVFS